MTAIEFNYAIHQASKALKSFANRLTNDADDANDLLQETLIKAFLNKDKYTDGTNLKAWLYTIMKNTFITHYQKMVRRNTFIDVSDNLHFLNYHGAAVENEAYRKFTMEDIRKAMSAVEEVYRKPFEMFYEGFKYHEISENMCIPIGTVKNRIHIARKELKDKLQLYRCD